MAAGDPLGDREAEPRPGRLRVIQPDESFEDALPVGLGNAGAVVEDLYLRIVIVRPYGDGDVAAGRRGRDRVIEEVSQRAL